MPVTERAESRDETVWRRRRSREQRQVAVQQTARAGRRLGIGGVHRGHRAAVMYTLIGTARLRVALKARRAGPGEVRRQASQGLRIFEQGGRQDPGGHTPPPRAQTVAPDLKSAAVETADVWWVTRFGYGADATRSRDAR
jgi:hypothetical protein